MQTIQQLWEEYHAKVVRGSKFDNSVIRLAFCAGALCAYGEAMHGTVTAKFFAEQFASQTIDCLGVSSPQKPKNN